MNPWLTSKGACAYAECSMSTVMRAAWAGELHGVQRAGKHGSWRFRAECVDSWIEGLACGHKANVTRFKPGTARPAASTKKPAVAPAGQNTNL